ncbi:MAG: putative toxin-antitoxin system toxin component, PIN family [Solirubrobacteraceae bacterium]|nr:putative toxin-antitoxin system toxin component, PIN family [Solirubrobacteraceae bacterium]
MIRVVVDTGVFVSALINRGGSPPDQVMDQWIAGRIQVIASPRLLAEVEEVVHRVKFRRWFDEATAAQLVQRLRLDAVLHDDPPDGGLRTRDPKDDYLLALAQATGADAVVSGDGDLGEADQGVVAVWTPRELVERVAGSS